MQTKLSAATVTGHQCAHVQFLILVVRKRQSCNQGCSNLLKPWLLVVAIV